MLIKKRMLYVSHFQICFNRIDVDFPFGLQKKSDGEIKFDDSRVVSGKVYGKAFKT
ncbi:hypothetical protein GJU39_18830 [Pedobacter petrophilus]|uniref:Uncharacterized protein n=1 Tax=Pedobacter petrophilus TaxID=1908241 RepID=A0A7K0G2W1_9SPHI|nr:hypothetical protein [Pedobacter petrophilus]MRX78138.1 hypothetical protein [Pedobacter petrophilus]